MTEDFLSSKSHMWTPFQWFFFRHKTNFQLQVRIYLAMQIIFFSGTIKDLYTWFIGNKGFFLIQNSHGHTMVWSSISSDFFDFTRFDRKSIKIGYKPDSKSLGHFKSFWLVQKSYECRFFLRVDPFPSGRGGGGGVVNQKVASMRLKIGQRVAYG